jgi:hypothetical protein
MNLVEKDGYLRRVHDDCVIWYLDNDKPDADFVVARFPFVVARFPFVPDYHLCDWIADNTKDCERPLQHFKTLTQALAVLRVIEGSSL